MGGMRFTTFDLGGHQQGQSFYRAKTITKLSIHLFIVELNKRKFNVNPK
jgi:hypothetical protein